MRKHILITLLMLCALTIQAQSAIDYSYGEVVYRHDTIAQTATARIWGVLLNKTVAISDTVQKGQYSCAVTSIKRELMPCWGNLYAQYEEIYLPRTIRNIEDGTFDENHHLKAIHVAEDNPYYTTIDGVLYDKKVERLIACPQAKADTLVLPKTVKRIDKKAFRNCHGLAFIDVEEGNKVYHSEYGLLLKKHTLIAYPAKRAGTCKVYKKSAPKQKEKKSKKEKEDQNKSSNTTGWNYFDPDIIGTLDYIEFEEGLCYIPNSVHSIAPYAITCGNIYRFGSDQENKYFSEYDGVLYSKNKKTLILYPGQWQNKHVLIPEGVTSIAPYAFYCNQHIHEITLPTTLKKIGKEAFYGTDKLRHVFNNSLQLQQVGKNAFVDYYEMDQKCMFVPNQAKRYYYHKNWTHIYTCPLFYSSGDTYPSFSVSAPDRLLVFEGSEFEDFENLYPYMDIIEHVQARLYAPGISPFIFFPNIRDYEVLGDKGHSGISKDGVLFYSLAHYFNDSHWRGSLDMKLMAFPAARTGDYVVPDSVVEIMNHAFDNCHLSTLTISDSVKYVDQYLNESEFDWFEVTPDNPVYCAIDGVLFRRDGVMRAYPRNKKDSAYTVPMGTKIISLAAFMWNTYLQEVHITDSVHTILNDAFYGCNNMKNVYIYATQPPYIYCTYPVPYERRDTDLFPEETKIYVPEESLEEYKKAPIWEKYADQIFPMPKKENE